MDPPAPRQNTAPASANATAEASPYHDPDCIFCQIITTYPVIDPLDPVFPHSPELDPEKVHPPSFVLLSTPHVVAFLDIYPLTRGHVLVCPRRHAEKVGDMTSSEGVEMGRILPLLSRAVCRATMPDIPHADVDYNLVQNNGPGAAQVVPHTHFHIVPRYPFNSQYTPFGTPATRNFPDHSSSSSASSGNNNSRAPTRVPQGMKATAILFGRGQRHYRDDDDAFGLVELMRRTVAEEWRREFGGLPRQERGATGGEPVGGDGGHAAVEDRDEGQAGLGSARKSVGMARENDLPVLDSRGGGDWRSRGKGGRL